MFSRFAAHRAVRLSLYLFLSLVSFAPRAFAQGQPRLEDLLARARPSAEELALSSELDAARREFAATSRRLAGGATLGAETGPRRTGSSTEADLAIDLDLPLLAKANGREGALSALERAAALLPAAARWETRGRIAAAYVAAWSAERQALLRDQDVAIVERWLGIARRRLEQGAEAAFEVDLIAFDLEQARGARAEALVARSSAWAELAVWVEPPLLPLPEPEVGAPLDEPIPPDLVPKDELPARVLSGSLAEGIAARRELAVALAQFDDGRARSRWAIRSSLAREAEERVARFGLAYRLPLAAERPVADRALESAIASADREAEQRTSELQSRLAAARSRLTALGASEVPLTGEEALSPERTLAAIELRLVEGKSHASEALLMRRAVIAAQIARIERRAARIAASWELSILTTEVLP